MDLDLKVSRHTVCLSFGICHSCVRLPPRVLLQNASRQRTHHRTTVHGRTEECNRCHDQFHRSICLPANVGESAVPSAPTTGFVTSPDSSTMRPGWEERSKELATIPGVQQRRNPMEYPSASARTKPSSHSSADSCALAFGLSCSRRLFWFVGRPSTWKGPSALYSSGLRVYC